MYPLKKVLLLSLLISIIGATHCSEEVETATVEADIDDESQNTTCYYLLPYNVIPNEYYIRITPFIIPDNFTFDGIVRINLTIIEATSVIVLHVDNMTIHDVTVSIIDKEKNTLTELDVENITSEEKYNFLNIEMKSPITADTNVTIVISYTGELNNNMYGFFRDWVKVDNDYKYINSDTCSSTYIFNSFNNIVKRFI